MTPPIGVPAGEEATDERLVDQRHVWGAGRVARVDVAPLQDAGAVGREPAGRHHVHQHVAIALRQFRRARHADVEAPRAVADGRDHRSRRGANARKSGHGIRQPLEQLHAGRRFDLAAQGVDVDDENLIAIESQPNVREPREGSDEETRGDDQDERERDLRDDEAARHADATVTARARARAP